MGMNPALQFERGHALLDLRQGVLELPDGRLLGGPLALLGNGRIHAGSGAAVLRVAVARDLVESARGILNAGGREGGVDFQPLETPDRWFADLELSWTGGEALVRLGEGGAVVPLGEFVKLLQR